MVEAAALVQAPIPGQVPGLFQGVKLVVQNGMGLAMAIDQSIASIFGRHGGTDWLRNGIMAR